MDSPSKAMKEYEDFLGQAASDMEAKSWEAARAKLDKAIAMDPVQAKAYDMLATCYEGLHDPDQADHYRARAKAIRLEHWERQVEAEARGKHEVLGRASRTD